MEKRLLKRECHQHLSLLRYSDKYYIYKYEPFRVAKELFANYMPKRNGYVESLIGGNLMYDEMSPLGHHDIRGVIEAVTVPSCYPDSDMRIATIDVGLYPARYYLEVRKSEQERAC